MFILRELVMANKPSKTQTEIKMGYTHYWRPQRSFTEDEWASIKHGFNLMIQKSTVLLAGPDGEKETPIQSDDKILAFNGVDDDSHETFWIDRKKVSNFEFCKTASKPYDEIVTAMLIYIDHVAFGAFDISSDGDMGGPDWERGRELFNSI